VVAMSLMPHPKVIDALASIDDGSATIRRHSSYSGNIRSPNDFAKALGYAIDRIAKTVFIAERGVSPDRRLQYPARSYGAVCLPAPNKINFKQVAQAFGWTACEIANPNELRTVLDYPSGGVSPLGLGEIRLIVDEALLSFSTILIGGGEVGVEVEIRPELLISLSHAAILKADPSI
jgi:Cys-tRNA(Pro)/Cys-tRNA(Cys) deacylase